LIKAICFDADGVMVNPAFQFSRHLDEVHGIAPQTTMSFFTGIFNDCLIGEKRIREELPPYLESWGWRKGVDAFIQTWLEQDDVVDAKMVHGVKQLRKAGLTCCLATNQEHNRAAYMRNQMGFETLFDVCFISCEIGCQKPDTAYYRHIENALKIQPEEILFWDDSKGHVQAARQRGWMAEVYRTYDEFMSLMKVKYALNWQE
jgi:putative hydrolase of the HAD superfamily